jgi:hypothetical protein
MGRAEPVVPQSLAIISRWGVKGHLAAGMGDCRFLMRELRRASCAPVMRAVLPDAARLSAHECCLEN